MSNNKQVRQNAFARKWVRFWLHVTRIRQLERIAAWLISWFAPPHKDQVRLAQINPHGFTAHNAAIYHANLERGRHTYIGNRVIIYQAHGGGPVRLGNRVSLLRDTIIETGQGGSVTIGDDAYIHPRCQINAYLTSVQIGRGVMLAANCALYPHNHGVMPGQPIRKQPLETKGPIIIGDDAWLGTGVVVLGGVRIGHGAVIGAGAVVTHDIPNGAIATGVPAHVVKMRSDLNLTGVPITPAIRKIKDKVHVH